MAAKTKQEVEQQSKKDRLWDSLDYSYGEQRKASDKAYDQARSQADRQALSRGMQRSSYNNQTLANIDKQKIDAQQNIYNAQIADYQNRLTDLENQEKEDERWERQFAEGQRQFNESQTFTAQQNELNRAFQTSEREAQQGYNTAERIAQQEYNTAERAAQQAYQSGENALAREFQAQQNTQNQQWQSGENSLNRQQSQSQFDTQFGYQKERDAIEDAFRTQQMDTAQKQWEAEFGLNTKTAEQQIAMSYINNIMSNGGTPSDDLLQQAGLSREDYNAMKKKASGSVGKPKTEAPTEETPITFSDFIRGLLGGDTSTKDSVKNDTSLASSTSTGNSLFGSPISTNIDAAKKWAEDKSRK